MKPREGVLHVFLERAIGLPVCNSMSGSTDAYAIVRWGLREPLETKVIKSSLNPKFNKTLDFQYSNKQEVIKYPLIIELWDEDVLSPDDLIGSASIDISYLSQIPLGQYLSLNIPLYGINVGICGSIIAKVSLDPSSSIPKTIPLTYSSYRRTFGQYSWGLLEDIEVIQYDFPPEKFNLIISEKLHSCKERIIRKGIVIGASGITGFRHFFLYTKAPKKQIIIRVYGTAVFDTVVQPSTNILVITDDDIVDSFSIGCPIFASRVILLTPSTDLMQIFAEMRSDLRKQAEAFNCDLIINYKESIETYNGIAIATSSGTCCVRNSDNKECSYFHAIEHPSISTDKKCPICGIPIMEKIYSTCKRPSIVSDGTLEPHSFETSIAYTGKTNEERVNSILRGLQFLVGNFSKDLASLNCSAFEISLNITFNDRIIALVSTCMLNEPKPEAVVGLSRSLPSRMPDFSFAKVTDDPYPTIQFSHSLFKLKELDALAFYSAIISKVAASLENRPLSGLALSSKIVDKDTILVGLSCAFAFNAKAAVAITPHPVIEGSVVKPLCALFAVFVQDVGKQEDLPSLLDAIAPKAFLVLRSQAEAINADAIVSAHIDFVFVHKRDVLKYVIAVASGDAAEVEDAVPAPITSFLQLSPLTPMEEKIDLEEIDINVDL